MQASFIKQLVAAVPRTQISACFATADSEEGIQSLATALRVLRRASVVAGMGPRSSTYLSGSMWLYGHGARYNDKSYDKGYLVIETYTGTSV